MIPCLGNAERRQAEPVPSMWEVLEGLDPDEPLDRLETKGPRKSNGEPRFITFDEPELIDEPYVAALVDLFGTKVIDFLLLVRYERGERVGDVAALTELADLVSDAMAAVERSAKALR